MNIPVFTQLDNDEHSVLSVLENGGNNNHHNDGDDVDVDLVDVVVGGGDGGHMVTQQDDVVVDNDEDDDDNGEVEDTVEDDNVNDVDEVVDVDDDDGDDEVVEVDDDNNGVAVANEIPATPKKKMMNLVWNKKALKSSKGKVEVRAYLRSPKNNSSKVMKKKQRKLKVNIDRSPDRSLAISIENEEKSAYIKNFYKLAMEHHLNKLKNEKK